MRPTANQGAIIVIGIALVCGSVDFFKRRSSKYGIFDPNEPLSAKMSRLRRRTQPLAVQSLIFGCSPLAGLFQPMRDEDAEEAIKVALELGYVDFDTAPHYGCGKSEERLGNGLAFRQDKPVRVWSKVGRIIKQQDDVADDDIVEVSNRAGHPDNIFPETPLDVAPVLDYSAEGARKSHAGSQTRIGTPIYGLRVHDCEDEWRVSNTIAPGGAIEGLVALKKEGLIKEVSLGLNNPDYILRVLHAFPPGTIDNVMVANAWNLLDQSAGLLLSECQRLGVKVHNAGIYASGFLVGGTTYRYGKAPPDIVAKTDAWGKLAAKYAVPLPVVAMAFAMGPQIIDKMAVGMKNAVEVRQSVQWLNATNRVPSKLWTDAKDQGLLEQWVPVPGCTTA